MLLAFNSFELSWPDICGEECDSPSRAEVQSVPIGFCCVFCDFFLKEKCFF